VQGKRLRVENDCVLEDVCQEENGLYAIIFQHEIDHDSQRVRMIDNIGRELELT
jgi:peptide deformylase